jgi:hypothetical protein
MGRKSIAHLFFGTISCIDNLTMEAALLDLMDNMKGYGGSVRSDELFFGALGPLDWSLAFC